MISQAPPIDYFSLLAQHLTPAQLLMIADVVTAHKLAGEPEGFFHYPHAGPEERINKHRKVQRYHLKNLEKIGLIEVQIWENPKRRMVQINWQVLKNLTEYGGAEVSISVDFDYDTSSSIDTSSSGADNITDSGTESGTISSTTSHSSIYYFFSSNDRIVEDRKIEVKKEEKKEERRKKKVVRENREVLFLSNRKRGIRMKSLLPDKEPEIPEEKKETIRLCRKLKNILTVHRRLLRPPNERRWIKQMEVIRDHFTSEEIDEVLDWLDENMEGDFTPTVRSCSTLMDKIGDILKMARRGKKKRPSINDRNMEQAFELVRKRDES